MPAFCCKFALRGFVKEAFFLQFHCFLLKQKKICLTHVCFEGFAEEDICRSKGCYIFSATFRKKIFQRRFCVPQRQAR